MKFSTEILQNKKTFFALLLLASILFRLPTLFNDFYDVDELSAIVQTHEYFAGDRPGVDFTESKLPLYHAIFKLSYMISGGHGWVIVHFITMLIIFFTSYYIYKISFRLRDHRTGVLAAFMYAIMISSFNRHFLATNGEIVFNLPLTAGLYCLICFLTESGIKRIMFLTGAVIMGIAAAEVKFHGIILILFMIFFFLIYLPYLNNNITRKFLAAFSLSVLAFLVLFILDYNISRLLAPRVFHSIGNKIFYVIAKGTDPLYFLVRYIHRQGMLVLWHGVIWLPAIAYIISFIKNRFRAESISQSAVSAFSLAAYIMVLAGGARLYFHYFMPLYPPLAVLASMTIYRSEKNPALFVRKRLAAFMLVPSIFFLLWNTKDVVIKHYFPEAFYGEGKALYWTRAVLVGTFNDYLLPDASIKDACEYIRNNTRENDRLFVWGDGPALYYFSERRMGIKHLWPKTRIIKFLKLQEKNDFKSFKKAKKIEIMFINDLEKKKPELFIDTSENGFSTFNYPVTPLVREYVDEHYSFETEISKIKIYRIKK